MNRATATTIQISLHQADPSVGEALFAAQPVEAEGGKAPEWIHLLPREIATHDNRGPYTMDDAAGVIAASIHAGDRLVIDENHATDLAAPKGFSAPARGWIVGLEARDDGIWGKVEWTAEGARQVAAREYRGISPVIKHTNEGKVLAILRASLVNRPNLRGLTTLHQETTMNPLLLKLLEALGLPTATSEDTLVTAVKSLHAANGEHQTALQAQLAPIAKAVGLQDGADATAIIGAVDGLRTSSGNKTVEALQSELTTLATSFNALKESTAREKATAFVDGAIREKRVGVSPLREHYISRHMTAAADVEKEINSFPMLGQSHTTLLPPVAKEGEVSLNAEEDQVARQLGIDPKVFAKTRDGTTTAAA